MTKYEERSAALAAQIKTINETRDDKVRALQGEIGKTQEVAIEATTKANAAYVAERDAVDAEIAASFFDEAVAYCKDFPESRRPNALKLADCYRRAAQRCENELGETSSCLLLAYAFALATGCADQFGDSNMLLFNGSQKAPTAAQNAAKLAMQNAPASALDSAFAELEIAVESESREHRSSAERAALLRSRATVTGANRMTQAFDAAAHEKWKADRIKEAQTSIASSKARGPKKHAIEGGIVYDVGVVPEAEPTPAEPFFIQDPRPAI